eukprot:scaffold260015_cov30-Tisochrysis_lutea.AAC.1
MFTCVCVNAGASAGGKAPLLEMHVSNDTTVSVPISQQAVKQLQAAIAAVLQTFAAKQKAERPQRWPMMEWRFKHSRKLHQHIASTSHNVGKPEGSTKVGASNVGTFDCVRVP